MALSANALTTVSTINDEVTGTTGSTAKVERLIAVASDAIEAYCARKFAYLEREQKYSPPEGERLMLECFPIDSDVTPTITLDGTSITDFSIEDADLGYLWRDWGWQGGTYQRAIDGSISGATVPGTAERVLVVTYTAGWVTPGQAAADPQLTRDLPYDLEQACIDTVASLWRRRGVDVAAAGFDAGGASFDRGFGGLIPGPVIPTLKRYLRWG